MSTRLDAFMVRLRALLVDIERRHSSPSALSVVADVRDAIDCEHVIAGDATPEVCDDPPADGWVSVDGSDDVLHELRAAGVDVMAPVNPRLLN